MTETHSEKTRTETDSIGPIEVPETAYWGAQTQRSIANFPFAAHERMPIGIIHGLAHVKRAAALVHRKSGELNANIADAIIDAADAIIAGQHDGQFPLTIWQTGSGTQSNMNMNEVIAGIANEALTGQRGGKSPVHPNDHVNKGQSSNDSFPTAIHVAVALAAERQLRPALDRLLAELDGKAEEWKDIVKIGRTHLQDATPLTLGQEFSAYVQMLAQSDVRLTVNLTEVHLLAQGGTAVGTGLNAPPDFGTDIAKEISTATGLDFETAPNKFEALSSHDALVDFSGHLNTLAVALTKIANDTRLLGSGPRSGLGEITLPANEPGSSIMPGKVNPTQCEMLTMVAAQVIGNHQAVTVGGMQGHLELNVFKPLIGANVLRSIDLLATGMDSFARRCVVGLEPNTGRITELVERSLMLVTALAPVIGYDNAAKIAKYAHENGLTLKQAGIALDLVDEATFDTHIKPKDMTGLAG
ncbi:class II fumarate hydratase [Sphingorhabdus sp. Alg239-R122]|uniref:class II fumarate hydratase n=1 Tax=Sphingorhabdus sp. Alg239-R122 TaxID=2305989 RepID=UPI0013DA0629|nr:class II fumarate hydratase [Sphingorhabdus sp. Alg239-R122]